MKTVVPDYYKEFHCTADRCKHNCCIGWQIDIDEESLAFYQSCTGEIGEKLRRNIAPNTKEEEAPAHFVLGEKERCPFLNEKNLCQIYSELGEEHICSICAEHPRFYNFWSDRTEAGYGMACEEAARIILSKRDPMVLEVIEDDGEEEDVSEEEQQLYALRQTLLSILQNRSYSTDERVAAMLKYCGYESSGLVFTEGVVDDIACEQLAVYLLYRNYADVLYDGRLKDRILFAAENYCSLRNIWAEKGSTKIEDLVEPVRAFSQKVEYDTDTWEIES